VLLCALALLVLALLAAVPAALAPAAGALRPAAGRALRRASRALARLPLRVFGYLDAHPGSSAAALVPRGASPPAARAARPVHAASTSGRSSAR
jgi:hypothetical protein